jgi:hypothetical protein
MPVRNKDPLLKGLFIVVKLNCQNYAKSKNPVKNIRIEMSALSLKLKGRTFI